MWIWIGRLWALPVTLGAALLYVPFLGVRFIRIRDGVIHVGVRRMLAKKGIRGQTFGDLVLTKDVKGADTDEDLWDHEMIHVEQCHAAGVLVVPGYPLCALMTLGMPTARGAYRDHPMECQASKLRRVRKELREAKKEAG